MYKEYSIRNKRTGKTEVVSREYALKSLGQIMLSAADKNDGFECKNYEVIPIKDISCQKEEE